MQSPLGAHTAWQRSPAVQPTHRREYGIRRYGETPCGYIMDIIIILTDWQIWSIVLKTFCNAATSLQGTQSPHLTANKGTVAKCVQW